MEGMWTRFFPLLRTLQNLLHEENIIGDVRRVFCDFGLDMRLYSLPKTSRLKDVGLGAGSLLDIGTILMSGGTASMPSSVTIRMKAAGAGKDLGNRKAKDEGDGNVEEKGLTMEKVTHGRGFITRLML
jgi:predicted dehydrogenase